MGCIKTESYGSCISVSARRIDGINLSASRIDGIKIRCSLICDVGKDAYLRVTPTEAQWIDVDEVAVFKVRSNENWKIV